ncbi:MAG: hypothetical protein JNL60_06280 [Bacteroidia bacterium]|nr:hypothetical protein [Bacteroidia bacterium]
MITCILIACKKGKQTEPEPNVYHQPETLKPLSYYPMFPGSYWIYLNQKGDSVKFVTDNTYKKHCYNRSVEDTVLVPFLKGPGDSEGHPIYQYDVISEFPPRLDNKPVLKRTTYISEVVGKQFKRGGFDSRYGDHRDVFTVKEKIKLNNDSVLVITGGNFVYSHTERYAKNVGLIWSCKVDSSSKDTIERLSLVKFYINR